MSVLTQRGRICRLSIQHSHWTMGLNEQFPRGHCLWEPAANAFYSPDCGFRQRQQKLTERETGKHFLVLV